VKWKILYQIESVKIPFMYGRSFGRVFGLAEF